MTRRGVIGLLIGMAALSTSGCSSLFPARYRFRMSVEVETPQGARTGSSVLEASATKELLRTSESPVERIKLRGEAVAVDLPGKQTLFALVEEDWPRTVAELFVPGFSAELEPYVRTFTKLGGRAMRGQVRELPREKYPRLVRFRDVRDPTSIEAVDPDNLAASFGPSVRLRRIAVQITSDRVTRGILKRLPSYGPETGFDKWFGDLPFGDPRQISLDSFKKM